MKCPQCNSDSIIPSRRRGMEKFLQNLYPRSPYRCRECWNRFWSFDNPFKSLASKITAGTIVLFLVLPPAMLQVHKNHQDDSKQLIRMKIADPYFNLKQEPIQDKKSDQPVPAAQKESEEIVKPKENVKSAEVITNAPAQPAATAVSMSNPVTTPIPPQNIPAPVSSASTNDSVKVAANIPTPAPQQNVEPQEEPLTVESLPKQIEKVRVQSPEKKSKPNRIEQLILKNIQSKVSENDCQIIFLANGPLQKYNFFDPKDDKCPYPKRVIDIEGVKLGSRDFQIENAFIKKIRTGESGGKLRIVFDLKVNISSRNIQETSDGLVITLKR